MKPSRLCVAMHEAGHAVVQFADSTAPWIDYIDIDSPPDGADGIVWTDSMWQSYMAEVGEPNENRQNWRRFAWRDIIIDLAGTIAELRWRRLSKTAIYIEESWYSEYCLGEPPPKPHTDFGRVRARLLWAHPGEEREAFQKAWRESEAAVAIHWRRIEYIGRRLNEMGYLSDVQLRHVWRVPIRRETQ